MAQILMAWTRRSRVFHIAAGREHRTACGCATAYTTFWTVGDKAPEGRTLCSRCVRAQADAGR